MINRKEIDNKFFENCFKIFKKHKPLKNCEEMMVANFLVGTLTNIEKEFSKNGYVIICDNDKYVGLKINTVQLMSLIKEKDTITEANILDFNPKKWPLIEPANYCYDYKFLNVVFKMAVTMQQDLKIKVDNHLLFVGPKDGTFEFVIAPLKIVD